jgi:hypothetical protein
MMRAGNVEYLGVDGQSTEIVESRLFCPTDCLRENIVILFNNGHWSFLNFHANVIYGKGIKKRPGLYNLRIY